MNCELHVFGSVVAAVARHAALTFHMKKRVAQISAALRTIQSDLRQIGRTRKTHTDLVASRARPEVRFSYFSAGIVEKHKGKLPMRPLGAAWATLPLFLVEPVAGFILASEPGWKRLNAYPASSVKALYAHFSVLTQSLYEAVIRGGGRHRPRRCSTLKRAAQFVGIDICDGYGLPAHYLPDVALRVERLMRKQAEKYLRGAT